MNQFLSDMVAEYIYTRSPRQDAYVALFLDETIEDEKMEKEVEAVAKILSIFRVARKITDFMDDEVALITFIDNCFSNTWLDMLEYASYRSYGCRYLRILLWAAREGLLVSIDSASVLRGDLDEHFAEVLECAGIEEEKRAKCFEWIAREE